MPKDENYAEEERDLIMRVIRYVRTHHRVTLYQIQAALDLDDKDMLLLDVCILKKDWLTNSPNDILCFVGRPATNTTADTKSDEYQLLPNAIFSYVDYLELKAAKQQAVEAKHFSIIAIQIAVGSLVVGAFIGLLGILAQILM